MPIDLTTQRLCRHRNGSKHKAAIKAYLTNPYKYSSIALIRDVFHVLPCRIVSLIKGKEWAWKATCVFPCVWAINVTLADPDEQQAYKMSR